MGKVNYRLSGESDGKTVDLRLESQYGGDVYLLANDYIVLVFEEDGSIRKVGNAGNCGLDMGATGALNIRENNYAPPGDS